MASVIQGLHRTALHWILTFGAEELAITMLSSWIPKFVEMVFLREADPSGLLPAIPASIRYHQGEKDRFLDSVHVALCCKELLVHTTIIAASRPAGETNVLIRELTFSSTMSFWGIPLPGCPECGNTFVRAIGNQNHGRGKEGFVIVKCDSCKRFTRGKGVERPSGVEEIPSERGNSGRFFWKLLDVRSPWDDHKWKSHN